MNIQIKYALGSVNIIKNTNAQQYILYLRKLIHRSCIYNMEKSTFGDICRIDYCNIYKYIRENILIDYYVIIKHSGLFYVKQPVSA